ncbi:hypothetical protein ANTRET_LOCUS1013 [Anthophora retusa]
MEHRSYSLIVLYVALFENRYNENSSKVSRFTKPLNHSRNGRTIGAKLHGQISEEIKKELIIKSSLAALTRTGARPDSKTIQLPLMLQELLSLLPILQISVSPRR